MIDSSVITEADNMYPTVLPADSNNSPATLTLTEPLEFDRQNDFLPDDWCPVAAMLEAMPGALCCLDENFIVRHWNQAMSRLLGVSAAEALWRPFFSLTPKSFEQGLKQEIQQLFLQAHAIASPLPQAVQGEFRQPHREGNGFMFRYQLNLLPTAAIAPLVMVSLSEAAPQKTPQQHQLHEQLLLLGKLNTSVAHELAGALDVICHKLDEILGIATPLGHQQLEAGLHDIITQIYRISYLTNNMVSLAQHGSSHLAPLDINEMILEALALLQQTMRHEVLCTMVLGPNLPPVPGDPILLQIVFQNLLKYAIAAAGEDAVPKVQTQQQSEGAGVIIRLEDRGPALHAHMLEHFFDPIHNAEKFGLGVGLGLFISKKIIEAHHGKILVNSRNSHGTEIVIELPQNIV
ncbi:PAS domain-containing protein [Cytophagia bacterium CHB2]|nr:PAS domain-containing protein [Cytophagia bacterium CHB2]